MEKRFLLTADEAVLKTETIASVVEEPLLMEWEIKAHSNWILPVDAGLGSLTIIAVCVYLWIIFFMEESSTRDFFKVTTAIAPIQMGFFWVGGAKKDRLDL